jgi:hypothetical protein
MPTRVTYWTGTWDGKSVSKEVSAQTGHRARAPGVSFAPGRCPAAPIVWCNFRGVWPILRAVAAVVERRGRDIFGGQSRSVFSRAGGRFCSTIAAGALPSGCRT